MILIPWPTRVAAAQPWTLWTGSSAAAAWDMAGDRRPYETFPIGIVEAFRRAELWEPAPNVLRFEWPDGSAICLRGCEGKGRLPVVLDHLADCIQAAQLSYAFPGVHRDRMDDLLPRIRAWSTRTEVRPWAINLLIETSLTAPAA